MCSIGTIDTLYMRYVYEVYLLLTYATKFPNSNILTAA